MARQGKLIVIEGTDGSGKGLQTKLLIERLQKDKYKVATASFPQYGKKSAGPVEEYLNGKYGDAAGLNPYAASLFFALDRFDLSLELTQKRKQGFTIILDRYVDSNAGHQGGKISDLAEREKFVKWLYDTEYQILKIPKPDIVIILHVPAEIGQKLILQKQQRVYLENGKKQDGHETNLEHLKNAEASYLWLAKKFPRDHKIIECVENGVLLSPENICEKAFKIIKSFCLYI